MTLGNLEMRRSLVQKLTYESTFLPLYMSIASNLAINILLECNEIKDTSCNRLAVTGGEAG